MAEQRRKHLRLPLESTTFIELMSPRAGDSEPGRLVTCKSLNVSRAGLQVSLGEQLTIGAILQIGIDLQESADTLYLAGEVRWCLETGDEQLPWAIGFNIMNSSNSDIARWIELLASMEN